MAAEDRTRNPDKLNTERIKTWRSIVTLIVFVIANIVVLFPFHIPIFVPRWLHNAFLDTLTFLRVIPSRSDHSDTQDDAVQRQPQAGESGKWMRYSFPVNFLTGPLIADIFLIAILAIGKDEIKAGTIGADSIHPLDIMLFFITLAYIAISIDASGLIRYMAFRVLQWGGKNGHRLFFYLYAFFFGLGSFIGNDPIILSGTAFLAYMTRVSKNINHPRAWIFTQFAMANISSAILVSSNPTNLVLAGAFNIRFIEYSANMIVPVLATVIILFPFLLYIVFANEELIPKSIEMHDLPANAGGAPVNPNIPNARGGGAEGEDTEETVQLSLEEIMRPFLDKKGAIFGAFIMATTLITVLAVNAAASGSGTTQHVFYVTVPAATLMLFFDLVMGWINRHETRKIAREGRQRIENARAQQESRVVEDGNSTQPLDLRYDRNPGGNATRPLPGSPTEPNGVQGENVVATRTSDGNSIELDILVSANDENNNGAHPSQATTIATPSKAGVSDREDSGSSKLSARYEKQDLASAEQTRISKAQGIVGATMNGMSKNERGPGAVESGKQGNHAESEHNKGPGKSNLVSLYRDAHMWAQETFPTVMAVFAHLPFALIPFAFCMFVLVQGLVSSGWVPVFAYGWDHWVSKTGTVGAIGGMGFLSVVLSNFSGTNIGTTILLCRVVQAWQSIHAEGLSVEPAIKDRDFWATVYSMAIGVNYGAFSTSFSASLAGLLWRDILRRKHIHVLALDFARVNLPIIAVSMVVGCSVLVGEVYLTRKDEPLQM